MRKLPEKHGQESVITSKVCPGKREGLRLESDLKKKKGGVGFLFTFCSKCGIGDNLTEGKGGGNYYSILNEYDTYFPLSYYFRVILPKLAIPAREENN